MNKLSIGVLALVVGVIIGAAAIKSQTPTDRVGGVTIEDETFNGPVTLNSTLTSRGAITSTGAFTTTGDATVSGGTLTVTSANTATSTAVVGCIQTYATSTATAVKLTLGKEASTATTTFYGGTSKGTLYWEYGTCPSL